MQVLFLALGRSGSAPLHRHRRPTLALCPRCTQVYRAVAGLVGEGGESDLPFAAAMIQAFNVILLTSPEVGRAGRGCPWPGQGCRGAVCYAACAYDSLPLACPCFLSRSAPDCSRLRQCVVCYGISPRTAHRAPPAARAPLRRPLPQLGEMRQLIGRAGWDPEGGALFTDLFSCWACSCGAALALCLLGQVRHAAAHWGATVSTACSVLGI